MDVRKVILFPALLIFVLGVTKFVKSIPMNGYHDYEKFSEEVINFNYNSEKWSTLSSEERSDWFFEYREKNLTGKFQLMDQGISLIVLSILIFLMNRMLCTGHKPMKLHIILFSIILLILLAPVIFFDLTIEMSRFAYPPWADSMGIPISGIPYTVASAGIVFTIICLGIFIEIQSLSWLSTLINFIISIFYFAIGALVIYSLSYCYNSGFLYFIWLSGCIGLIFLILKRRSFLL